MSSVGLHAPRHKNVSAWQPSEADKPAALPALKEAIG